MNENKVKAFPPKADVLNKFVVRGTVVSKYETDAALLVIIRSCPFTTYVDYPSIIFYDKELANKFNSEVKVGERVSVEGYVNTNKKHPEGTLISTGFKKEFTRLQAAFENGEYVEDANQVMISGTIMQDPFVTDDVTILTIKTFSSAGTLVIFKAVAFNRYASMAKNKKAGDKVRVFCFVKTQDKKTTNEKHSYQSFILRGIESIE